MRRLRKIVLWILGIALALPALALAVFFLTPSGLIADRIAAWSEARLGRPLVIAGPIERRLYPTLGLTAREVSLPNAPWAGDGAPLLRAERASFDVAFRPLLSGKVEIVEIALENPELNAEVSAEGAPNWILGEKPRPPEPMTQSLDPDAPPPAAAPAAPAEEMDLAEITRRLSVADARLVGGRLRYRDRRAASGIEIADLTLTGRLPAYDAPLEIDGSARINGQEATLTGRLADPAAIEAGAAARASLRFDGAGAALRFDGDVANLTQPGALSAKGAIEARLSDDRAATAWLRDALPAALAPLGAATLAGDLSASPEGLDLDLTGEAAFNGETSAVAISAAADRGWQRGENLVVTTVAVENRYLDAGYDGAVGVTPEMNLALDGAYRLRAPDVAALYAWALPGETPPLVERVDISGEARIADEAARVATTGVIAVNGAEVMLTAASEGPRGWRSGALLQTRFDAAAEGLFAAQWRGTLRFDPEAGPKVEGAAGFATGDLRALRQWAGAAGPERDYGPLAVDGRIFADAASLELEEGTIHLGGAATDARAVLAWDGPRPTISARLGGGPFEATPFLRALGLAPATAENADAARNREAEGAIATSRIETADSGGGWSKEPLRLDGLKALDGQIAVRLNGLVVDDIALGRTRVVARFVEGRLDLDIEEIQAFDGAVRGRAALAPSGTGAGARLDLTVAGVETEPLLAAFGRSNWIRGKVALTATLEAAGESLDALMRSLAGQARASMADGAVLAIDFADASLDGKLSALGAEQAVAGVTPFDQASLSAAFARGVMRTGDLTMTGPVVSVEGAGSVDLGERALDMVITPVRFGELAVLGIDRAIGSAFPIALRGPWTRIKVALDRSKTAPAAPGTAVVRERPEPQTGAAPAGGAQ